MQRTLLAALIAMPTLACSEYDLFGNEEDPKGPACDLPAPDAYVPDLTEACFVEPEIGQFVPVVEWTWSSNPVHVGYEQVMAQPVVANLDDDNGDGTIDEDDVPDVLFTAFSGGAYSSAGALVAVSGATGGTLWSVMNAGGAQPYASSGVAVADLEGDGLPEVLVTATTGLLCLDHTGGFRWLAPVSVSAYAMPAVGDLDGDGVAEVVLGRSAVGHDGQIEWVGAGGSGQHYSSYPVDLDGDGLQEVVAGNTVYEHDGAIRWQDGAGEGYTAVGDLDADGEPDIVKVGGGQVAVHDAAGALMWTTALTDGGGGPPTVADFDGDGLAEIGVASREVYRVLDGDGTVLWANTIVDYSSSVTGSSVFDFEGDGAAEVVYADEHTLWVFDGATGAVEMQWASHSSGTLIEYPVIVDVDRDGSAEIVVASNDYAFAGSHGITVIGDSAGSWAPARPVWNQHAYYITNIDPDNGVPPTPEENWHRWNSFRAGNSETAVGYDQPDLALGDPEVCEDLCGAGTAVVWLPVENRGVADVAEVQVALYTRDGPTDESLVSVQSLPVIRSAAARWLGPLELHRWQFGDMGLVVRVDDDGTGQGRLFECVEDNNAWAWVSFPCDF